MVVAFTAILFGLAVLVPPLRSNRFYLLNSACVVGMAWYTQNHWFRIDNVLSGKTILLFIVFQFISVNLTTFIAYGVDKRAARRKEWRVPERDLHTLEFLGGWPGAFAGQKFFHHKTSKKSYQNIYKLMIIMEFIAVIGILKFLHLM